MTFCALNLYGDIRAFILHLFLHVNRTKTDENSVYVTVFSLYLWNDGVNYICDISPVNLSL